MAVKLRREEVSVHATVSAKQFCDET